LNHNPKLWKSTKLLLVWFHTHKIQINNWIMWRKHCTLYTFLADLQNILLEDTSDFSLKRFHQILTIASYSIISSAKHESSFVPTNVENDLIKTNTFSWCESQLKFCTQILQKKKIAKNTLTKIKN